MRFADSHCHVGMLGEEADAALIGARAGGVAGFVAPATHLDDAPQVVALAARHADVWAAVGFHPHEAKDFDAAAEEEIRRLATAERVVAIGEIGLDYHYMHSPRETQKDVLLRQFAIARELDLPVIIHNRESTADLLAILESADGRGIRGVLHSYTESWDVAQRLLDRGFLISFSGIVTFRNAGALREVARRVPQDALLIETDTPFLAPMPHRGKRNEPVFVIDVARVIAEVRDATLEAVAEATSANFERFFGVKMSP